MLGSNNYLGLTTDLRVKKAAMDAVARYGTGLTGSRLLNGTLPLHTELEEFLADWVGMEQALVFTTGYTANLGLIATLVQAGDAVFCDSAAHASLVDGARLADGVLRAFRHNRPNSLRRGLQSWRSQTGSGGVLVAVDGIYSMEGDWAPLAEVRALCDQHRARLLVDEAHALGVVGPSGSGTSAARGVRADLIMGTFSKSLASCGGFIAGPAEVIEYLRLYCRPILFTASNVPASLGAALAAAKIAREEDWRRQVVLALAERLRRGLSDLGFHVGGTESCIVPVHVDDLLGTGILLASPARPGRVHQLLHPAGGPAAHAADVGDGDPYRGTDRQGARRLRRDRPRRRGRVRARTAPGPAGARRQRLSASLPPSAPDGRRAG